MKEVNQNNKIELIDRTVFSNYPELNYAESVNITSSKHPSRIFIPDNFSKKKERNRDDLKQLPEILVKNIIKRNKEAKNKYPKSEIITFLQFGKGNRLTDEQLQRVSKAEEGADVNLLYERDRRQSSEDYEDQLNSFQSKKKKGVVFEAESKEIEEKIIKVYNYGIRDFYIIAGKYNDLEWWRSNILTPVIQSEGRLTVVLLKRYDNKNRRSYITPMLDCGAQYIVHGSPHAPPEKKDFEVLFLDADGHYRKAENLLDEEIQSVIETYPKSHHYSLSRALAIDKANNIVKTRKSQPVITK